VLGGWAGGGMSAQRVHSCWGGGMQLVSVLDFGEEGGAEGR
jgi:hypothetical protein